MGGIYLAGFNAHSATSPEPRRFFPAEHILSRIAEQNIFKLHSEEKPNSFGRGRKHKQQHFQLWNFL